MAQYETPLNSPVGSTLVSFTQAYATNPETGDPIVTVSTITALTSVRLYAVDIDNTANTDAAFLKLFLGTGSFSVGDNPHIILKAPGLVRIQYTFDVGIAVADTIKGYACGTSGRGAASDPSLTGDIISRIMLGT